MESIDIPALRFLATANSKLCSQIGRAGIAMEYPLILAVARNSNAGVAIDLLVADLRNGGGRRRESLDPLLAICGTGRDRITSPPGAYSILWLRMV